MFKKIALFGLLSVVVASPILLQPRIAQVTAEATAKWEKACDAAGGGDQCNPISVTAMGTLLFGADACAQQKSADAMIDLAHQHGNDKEMIRLAQIFAQSPRNSPDKLSLDYCQQKPKNAELNGLFPCQFLGVDPQHVKGGLKAGSPGTIPLGLNAPVSPAGSCPAHKSGSVPDGVQLSDLVMDPGVTNASGNSTLPDDSNLPTSSGTDDSDDGDTSFPGPNNSTFTTGVSSMAPTPTPGNDAGFKLQNGQDAQALNAGFAKLSGDSGCTDGEQACIGGGFSQCVGGHFTTTPCAGGTRCFALPLVNQRGTSLACTTEEDALARIAASGASGGL